MAVTGTGTQADPYVVTTYGDLVEKATENNVYIELANDINIEDEYPNENMPTLFIYGGVQIDGKNKKISNWNKTNNSYNYCIGNNYSNDYTSQIKNLTFANIILPSGVNFAHYECGRGNTDPEHFYNCKFYGKMYAGIINGDRTRFKDCSINIERKSTGSFGLFNGGDVSANANGIYFNNCYIKMKWSGTASPVFADMNGINGKDSYFELEGNVNTMCQYMNAAVDNCVVDLITNGTASTGDNSGVGMSIFNLTHAPNITGGANFKGVTDANWLDTEYLSSIGFNAG